MLTRRSLMTSAAMVVVAPYLLSGAMAVTPTDIVVMAKTMDDIVSGFDPGETYEMTALEVGGNLYRTLVAVDPADSAKMVGDLAASWDVSPDGLTLTFHIRKGVVFESGKELTAEDAAFSLQRVVLLNKDPAFLLTQFGWTKDNVGKLIRASDKYTLTLTLPELQASGIVLSCLAFYCGSVVDKATVLAHEKDGDLGNGWLKTNSAGSGSYRLVKWQASDSIILEANKSASVKPRVPRLVIRHIADSATQLLLLSKGDVDIARDLGADQLKTIGQGAAFNKVSADALNVMALLLNMSLPEFQKPQVRQAIKWAIDYEGIAKNITPDVWNVWESFLPKGTPGALQEMPFHKDVAKAKALLVEAGYPDGFEITLDYVAKWPYADIAQAIQADLAAVGIKLRLLAGEQNQNLTKRRARQHQMAMSQVAADYLDPNSMAQWICANPDDSDATKLKTEAWRDHFADPEITAMVDKASKELDPDKRLEMYRQMQQLFWERAPIVVFLQQTSVAVLRSGVTGLVLGVLPNSPRYAGIAKA